MNSLLLDVATVSNTVCSICNTQLRKNLAQFNKNKNFISTVKFTNLLKVNYTYMNH